MAAVINTTPAQMAQMQAASATAAALAAALIQTNGVKDASGAVKLYRDVFTLLLSGK